MKYRITVETITDHTFDEMQALRDKGLAHLCDRPSSTAKLYEQTVDHLDIRQVIAAVNPQTQPVQQGYIEGSQQNHSIKDQRYL